uniref:Uncharacterized protein n=1 Tax=Rhizophora mucronata TaxID=61149 RepID=A0A2P2NF22_RHIMU
MPIQIVCLDFHLCP